jgi:chromosomal replication initiation ATPase DnaA
VIELTKDETDFLESLRAEGQHSSGSCSTCGGNGSWLNSEGKAVLCHCLKEQMWRDKYITAGIPPKYFGKSLTENWNLKQDPWGNNLTQSALSKKIKIKAVMDKYINALPALCAGRPIKIIPNRGTTINLLNLLLVGGQWSGKSLICSVIAQEAVRKKLSVAYIDYSDLYADLSGFDNREKQSDYAEEFAQKDLIIIDGITHYDMRNPTLAIQLDRIGRSRVKSNKPIIISAYDGFEKIDAGPGWSSMINACFKITLPTPLPPQPFAS